MKCRCKAARDVCDTNNSLCPASTTRLLYDEKRAMIELHAFAEQDEKEIPLRRDEE